MTGNLASFCGLIYLLSEIGLGVAKRARRGETQLKDAGSLRLLWIVIGISTFLAFLLAGSLPDLTFGAGAATVTRPLGLGVFIAGLALRWYAIVYLGRFFTVNVAIASDQRVIDTGPYRYVRHPSYTGALAAFLGIGLLLNHAAALVMITVPPLLVFLRRIHIEEAALLAGLGDNYRAYMRRTRRLVPGIY
jgi:protein-S-isoprenylcysteine O-methyltransferase